MSSRWITCLSSAAVAALVLLVVSCTPNASAPDAARTETDSEVLFTHGTVTVTQADLEYYLAEEYPDRPGDRAEQLALDELIEQAQFTHAALAAGLDRDPIVKSEVARILYLRLKEQRLTPQLKVLAASAISEDRLRTLYASQADRFQTDESRRVAVLWLNPGGNPQRQQAYQAKLNHARNWFFNNEDLLHHPERGFGALSVDYSQHHASRFKGGVVGWLQQSSGARSDWRGVVAGIAFGIDELGQVSEVAATDEGLFLVRLMGLKPAVKIPFESVRAQLEHEEKLSRRKRLEADFRRSIVTSSSE